MDIIIGASRLFGIKLPENFNAPFFSKNIQEFWQKWHITLGLWFKDYVMYPVQMSPLILNCGKFCKEKFGKKAGKKIPFYLSMSALWFLIGIWHGASAYYFIASGLVPFILITLMDIFKPIIEKFEKNYVQDINSPLYITVQRVCTFLSVSVCWFFVCSLSAKNSIAIVKHAVNSVLTCNIFNKFDLLNIAVYDIVIMLIGLSVLCFSDYLQNKGTSLTKFIDSQKPIVGYAVIYAEVLAIMIVGNVASSQFIYFRF